MAIALILIEFTDSNVPWADSFTTALSIVAMWMLAKKYAEQWLVWILIDIVSSGLYVYKASISQPHCMRYMLSSQYSVIENGYNLQKRINAVSQ